MNACTKLGLYIHAHWCKSTATAVALAKYNPSEKNITFAHKLLAVKMTHLDDCYHIPTELQEKTNKYDRLQDTANQLSKQHGFDHMKLTKVTTKKSTEDSGGNTFNPAECLKMTACCLGTLLTAC